MKNIALPDYHYSLSSSNDIIDICKPLFLKNKITHFCFVRYFNEGKCAVLITNRDLCQDHFNQGFVIAPNISENRLEKEFSHIALSGLDSKYSQALYNYKNLFNVTYPIFLFERCQKYVDFFIFATSNDNPSIINYYLNNIETLENFKIYFKNQAQKLIEKSIQNKITLPKHMMPNFNNLASLRIKNFRNDYAEISLTNREFEVISSLIKGCTIKKVAVNLNISPRTAETYFNNIKDKFGLRKKSEIIVSAKSVTY